MMSRRRGLRQSSPNFRLHFDFQVWGAFTNGPVFDAARGDDVVVLNQHAVGQAERFFAAAADGVFFKDTKPGNSFLVSVIRVR